MADLGKLDDADYPAFTTGQAAQMLGVQVAFLRSLDTAGVVRPERSEGGHRRYSRRQLELAARLREQFDQGHTLAAAARIVGLEDRLAAAEDEISTLRDRLADAETRSPPPG
ncbi:helix-turn-helix domain-containing protein [Amycolatopsis anabasis]|uniref:helix-turn-helix domain-containing protein n=1 Tax=Amycolatopsis anabasis TaxID=1840409 RepID=UPI001FE8B219|nr:helix-turn-helix domain-containing protein [Amycolatopsis anabasis]